MEAPGGKRRKLKNITYSQLSRAAQQPEGRETLLQGWGRPKARGGNRPAGLASSGRILLNTPESESPGAKEKDGFWWLTVGEKQTPFSHSPAKCSEERDDVAILKAYQTCRK